MASPKALIFPNHRVHIDSVVFPVTILALRFRSPFSLKNQEKRPMLSSLSLTFSLFFSFPLLSPLSHHPRCNPDQPRCKGELPASFSRRVALPPSSDFPLAYPPARTLPARLRPSSFSFFSVFTIHVQLFGRGAGEATTSDRATTGSSRARLRR